MDLKKLGLTKNNINKRNNQGFTPLMIAALYGNINDAKILLSNGADPNLLDSRCLKATALFMINANKHTEETRRNYPEFVKLLLDYGTNPNIRDMMDNTVLYYEFRKPNNVEPNPIIIKMLLEYGSDPNIQYYEGCVPLMLTNNIDILRMLLQHGARIDIKNNKGLTAIDIAKGPAKKYLKNIQECILLIHNKILPIDILIEISKNYK